jgi:hypothetical protein
MIQELLVLCCGLLSVAYLGYIWRAKKQNKGGCASCHSLNKEEGTHEKIV